MIDPQSLDLTSLPSVCLADRSLLPPTAGIYFAIDSLGAIQYIGRSNNVRNRWKKHNRYEELILLEGVKIAYLLVDVYQLLPGIEAALIAWFNPPLNKVIPSTNSKAVDLTPCGIKWKLAHIMHDKGVKTGELSKVTGLHSSTISKLKACREMPDRLDRTTLALLCKALDCTPGELLAYEEPPHE